MRETRFDVLEALLSNKLPAISLALDVKDKARHARALPPGRQRLLVTTEYALCLTSVCSLHDSPASSGLH